MIFKSDLIEAINGVSHDMAALAVRVSDIEKRLNKLEKKSSDKSTEARLQNLEDFMDTQTRINNEVPVRRVAKPRSLYEVFALDQERIQKAIGEEAASCVLNDAIEEAKKKKTKLTKSANVKKQPRTKDGKFAKKK
jgi:hypothetical protein